MQLASLRRGLQHRSGSVPMGVWKALLQKTAMVTSSLTIMAMAMANGVIAAVQRRMMQLALHLATAATTTTTTKQSMTTMRAAVVVVAEHLCLLDAALAPASTTVTLIFTTILLAPMKWDPSELLHG